MCSSEVQSESSEVDADVQRTGPAQQATSGAQETITPADSTRRLSLANVEHLEGEGVRFFELVCE